MRGVALKEFALLIVAVILIVILLSVFFLFQMPLLVFPTVIFDHLSTLVRGVIISGLWSLILPLIGVITALIFLDPSCWNPAGAIKCGAEAAIISAIVTGIIVSMMGSIPLFFFPVKLNGVSNGTFENHFADWIVDTNIMWNGGDSNPIWGKGPNPRISFIISLKNQKYNLSKAIDKLKWPYVSFTDRISGRVWEDNSVESGKVYHVKGMNFDMKIYNSKIYIYEDGSECAKLDLNLGSSESFKCSGKNYKIFVDKSEFGSNLYHVWIGNFESLYKHIKNIILIYNGKEYVIKDEKGWKGDIPSVDLSDKTVFIDFYDAVPFGGPDQTNECGKISNAKEGVYICIPSQGG